MPTFLPSQLAAAILGIALTYSLCSPSHADPSKPIRALLEAPASAFDVFLFTLHERSKCYQGAGVSDSKPRPELCMTTIDYNFDDNVIEMHFLVSQKHPAMHRFAAADDAGKRKILDERFKELVLQVGVGGPNDVFFGLIQNTPYMEIGRASCRERV